MSHTYPQFHDNREQAFYTPAGDGVDLACWPARDLAAGR